ncbi:hypothetical protein [Chelativorans sp.]|uniref:hypothetical protein n=1 Tax=Chelativorans sp. TaxID=2203393 RepID=UPI00281169C2|nr:hypothetical protein [Chelativorans sp.]
MGLFGESAAGALVRMRMASDLARKADLFASELGFHETLADSYLREPLRLVEGGFLAPPSLHLASSIDWEKLERLAQASETLQA